MRSAQAPHQQSALGQDARQVENIGTMGRTLSPNIGNWGRSKPRQPLFLKWFYLCANFCDGISSCFHLTNSKQDYRKMIRQFVINKTGVFYISQTYLAGDRECESHSWHRLYPFVRHHLNKVSTENVHLQKKCFAQKSNARSVGMLECDRPTQQKVNQCSAIVCLLT